MVVSGQDYSREEKRVTIQSRRYDAMTALNPAEFHLMALLLSGCPFNGSYSKSAVLELLSN
jgi:hypothetical protein